MKGFPNQVADLAKLAAGMRCIVDLADRNDNPRDDGVLGQALVHAGVAGAGHTGMPVNEYITQQLAQPASNQSFRTTARGLRELYRLLGFIDDDGDEVYVTDEGRRAAAFAGRPIDQEQIEFWRRAIRNMMHFGNDQEASHPYQVLLRLIAQRPGIERSKCALALEARNDSQQELARIVELSDLPEAEILRRIGVTKSNWDNAKKVLPKIAEQLEDVIKEGHTLMLAEAPGRARNQANRRQGPRNRVAAPRTSRSVTPDTIGRAGTVESFDEAVTPTTVDPQALANAANVRRERLRRHNQIVRNLARRLVDAELFEDPFDILALQANDAILIEVKTLDGSVGDERDRVREALSQLLYYEAFLAVPGLEEADISKIACFEGPITEAHRSWLNGLDVGVVWQVGNGFRLDESAQRILVAFAEQLG